MPLGQTKKYTGGRGAQASFDGNPEFKPAGITMDWSTVPANGAGATLADGEVIEAGVKYIPYGTVLTMITASRKYGPHEIGAVDGRQTPARGQTLILNRTIRADDLNADYPTDIIEGGRIYQDRFKLVTGGAFAAPTGAQLATILGVMPRILSEISNN